MAHGPQGRAAELPAVTPSDVSDIRAHVLLSRRVVRCLHTLPCMGWSLLHALADQHADQYPTACRDFPGLAQFLRDFKDLVRCSLLTNIENMLHVKHVISGDMRATVDPTEAEKEWMATHRALLQHLIVYEFVESRGVLALLELCFLRERCSAESAAAPPAVSVQPQPPSGVAAPASADKRERNQAGSDGPVTGTAAPTRLRGAGAAAALGRSSSEDVSMSRSSSDGEGSRGAAGDTADSLMLDILRSCGAGGGGGTSSCEAGVPLDDDALLRMRGAGPRRGRSAGAPSNSHGLPDKPSWRTLRALGTNRGAAASSPDQSPKAGARPSRRAASISTKEAQSDASGARSRTRSAAAKAQRAARSAAPTREVDQGPSDAATSAQGPESSRRADAHSAQPSAAAAQESRTVRSAPDAPVAPEPPSAAEGATCAAASQPELSTREPTERAPSEPPNRGNSGAKDDFPLQGASVQTSAGAAEGSSAGVADEARGNGAASAVVGDCQRTSSLPGTDRPSAPAHRTASAPGRSLEPPSSDGTAAGAVSESAHRVHIDPPGTAAQSSVERGTPGDQHSPAEVLHRCLTAAHMRAFVDAHVAAAQLASGRADLTPDIPPDFLQHRLEVAGALALQQLTAAGLPLPRPSRGPRPQLDPTLVALVATAAVLPPHERPAFLAAQILPRRPPAAQQGTSVQRVRQGWSGLGAALLPVPHVAMANAWARAPNGAPIQSATHPFSVHMPSVPQAAPFSLTTGARIAQQAQRGNQHAGHASSAAARRPAPVEVIEDEPEAPREPLSPRAGMKSFLQPSRNKMPPRAPSKEHLSSGRPRSKFAHGLNAAASKSSAGAAAAGRRSGGSNATQASQSGSGATASAPSSPRRWPPLDPPPFTAQRWQADLGDASGSSSRRARRPDTAPRGASVRHVAGRIEGPSEVFDPLNGAGGGVRRRSEPRQQPERSRTHRDQADAILAARHVSETDQVVTAGCAPYNAEAAGVVADAPEEHPNAVVQKRLFSNHRVEGVTNCIADQAPTVASEAPGSAEPLWRPKVPRFWKRDADQVPSQLDTMTGPRGVPSRPSSAARAPASCASAVREGMRGDGATTLGTGMPMEEALGGSDPGPGLNATEARADLILTAAVRDTEAGPHSSTQPSLEADRMQADEPIVIDDDDPVAVTLPSAAIADALCASQRQPPTPPEADVPAALAPAPAAVPCAQGTATPAATDGDCAGSCSCGADQHAQQASVVSDDPMVLDEAPSLAAAQIDVEHAVRFSAPDPGDASEAPTAALAPAVQPVATSGATGAAGSARVAPGGSDGSHAGPHAQSAPPLPGPPSPVSALPPDPPGPRTGPVEGSVEQPRLYGEADTAAYSAHGTIVTAVAMPVLQAALRRLQAGFPRLKSKASDGRAAAARMGAAGVTADDDRDWLLALLADLWLAASVSDWPCAERQSQMLLAPRNWFLRQLPLMRLLLARPKLAHMAAANANAKATTRTNVPEKDPPAAAAPFSSAGKRDSSEVDAALDGVRVLWTLFAMQNGSNGYCQSMDVAELLKPYHKFVLQRDACADLVKIKAVAQKMQANPEAARVLHGYPIEWCEEQDAYKLSQMLVDLIARSSYRGLDGRRALFDCLLEDALAEPCLPLDAWASFAAVTAGFVQRQSEAKPRPPTDWPSTTPEAPSKDAPCDDATAAGGRHEAGAPKLSTQTPSFVSYAREIAASSSTFYPRLAFKLSSWAFVAMWTLDPGSSAATVRPHVSKRRNLIQLLRRAKREGERLTRHQFSNAAPAYADASGRTDGLDHDADDSDDIGSTSSDEEGEDGEVVPDSAGPAPPQQQQQGTASPERGGEGQQQLHAMEDVRMEHVLAAMGTSRAEQREALRQLQSMSFLGRRREGARQIKARRSTLDESPSEPAAKRRAVSKGQPASRPQAAPLAARRGSLNADASARVAAQPPAHARGAASTRRVDGDAAALDDLDAVEVLMSFKRPSDDATRSHSHSGPPPEGSGEHRRGGIASTAAALAAPMPSWTDGATNTGTRSFRGPAGASTSSQHGVGPPRVTGIRSGPVPRAPTKRSRQDMSRASAQGPPPRPQPAAKARSSAEAALGAENVKAQQRTSASSAALNARPDESNSQHSGAVVPQGNGQQQVAELGRRASSDASRPPGPGASGTHSALPESMLPLGDLADSRRKRPTSHRINELPAPDHRQPFAPSAHAQIATARGTDKAARSPPSSSAAPARGAARDAGSGAAPVQAPAIDDSMDIDDFDEELEYDVSTLQTAEAPSVAPSSPQGTAPCVMPGDTSAVQENVQNAPPQRCDGSRAAGGDEALEKV